MNAGLLRCSFDSYFHFFRDLFVVSFDFLVSAFGFAAWLAVFVFFSVLLTFLSITACLHDMLYVSVEHPQGGRFANCFDAFFNSCAVGSIAAYTSVVCRTEFDDSVRVCV